MIPSDKIRLQAATDAELQKIYEFILQNEIHKCNFRKWALAVDQIEETGEKYRKETHRPAKLYRNKLPQK